MTREEQLDAALQDCIQTLEATKDTVSNHPIAQRIEQSIQRAKAVELPQEPAKETGVLKKLFGDRRAEERDPGEHEQHVAEELGLADK